MNVFHSPAAFYNDYEIIILNNDNNNAAANAQEGKQPKKTARGKR